MGSDLTFKPSFIKKPVSLEIEREKLLDTESKNGAILFDKKSGEQYRVKKITNVHGINHFQLASEITEQTLFLSEFAINERYSSQKSETKSFGDRIIVRLGKMFESQ